jgi:hypothetical protein
MVAYQNIYDSLADFIAGMEAEKVLAFHAPASLQERVEELLDKKEIDGLNDREAEELAHYYILEHIVRLAKSRTRLRLAKHQA